MSVPSGSVYSRVLAVMGILITVGLILGIVLNQSETNDGVEEFFQGTAFVDYGNSTVESHSFNVSQGTTAFIVFDTYWNLTVRDYGGLGTYIVGINGVLENSTSEHYWLFWYSPAGTEQWQYSNLGVSAYEITENIDLRFVYSDLSA